VSGNVRAENAGAQPSDMPVRDPPSARRKRTRDAQSAFAELIARDPPPRRSRRGLGAAARGGDDAARRGARVSAPLRSTSSSLDLRLPALGLRAGDVREPDTQTQTQTVDGRPPSDDIAVRDVRDVSDDDENENENDAFAAEAFGDARALVGGGAGLSPRTLKRNERDLLRALAHDGDADGDAARFPENDIRAPEPGPASVGGTQEVNTQDAALDPYLRLARAARRAAAGPVRSNDPGASRERDSQRLALSKTSLSKTLSKRNAHETAVVTSLPLAGLRVYLHSDVRGKRREIFAEKLPALGAEMATDAEKTALEISTSRHLDISKQDPDPAGSYRFVAVTSDAEFLATLEHPVGSSGSLGSRVVAVCPEWAVECIKRRARADPARFPPSAAAGRAPPRAAEGDHAYAGASRGSSIAERRRAALEKTAEAEARRAADSAAAAARPPPGSSRDAVMASSAAADAAAASARAAIAAAAAAGGAPPSWVAIPDSESQERPYLGRVKERLVCQKPTSTALVRGGGRRPVRSAGPVPAPDDSPSGDSPPRGGDASAEEAGDGTKTLTTLTTKTASSEDAPRPPGGFNARLIEPLLELADIYETVLAGTDKYKAKHHKTVAGALRELDFEVTDVNQLCAHPVTGDPLTTAFGKPRSSVRDKIHQILTTGKLPKLETLKRDPRVSALLALGKIWGVGPETARRLYGSGYASIDALRAAVAAEDNAGKTDPGRVLSHAQRVGLRHYGEFEEKMPRAEAAAIGALVRDAVDAACGPGRCRVTLAGSFRRGKRTCGDVDVLVAPSDAFATDASAGEGDGDGDDARALVAREPLSSSLGERRTLAPPLSSRRYVDRLDDILPATLALLRKSGLITDDLNSGERRSYMGVCRLPPETRVTDREDETEGTLSHQKTETDARLGTASGTPAASPSPSRPRALPPRRFRRLDIKVYSPEEYPFALLYFTGSGYFNRSMRWWADKKFRGLSLGDKGFRLQSGARESSFKHDPRFRGTTFSTEKDIFDFLKLRYVEPEDRCV